MHAADELSGYSHMMPPSATNVISSPITAYPAQTNEVVSGTNSRGFDYARLHTMGAQGPSFDARRSLDNEHDRQIGVIEHQLRNMDDGSSANFQQTAQPNFRDLINGSKEHTAASGMPLRGLRSDEDPYQPQLTNDLLQGKNEWKNIQEIVKLTFKAIADTVKSQGTAIRDLEKSMSAKVTGSDMVAAIHNKVNVSDVSKMMADLQSAMEEKQSAADVTRMLDDKVTKQDLQYMLSNKVSLEELSRVLLQKANVHEVNLELSQMNQRLEDLAKDVNTRMQSTALQKDVAYMGTMLDKKADLDFVNDALA